ncbi:M1 family metallopeptidase [Roseateles sp. DB2]|uniref:M1 family metallopeptidase n=1 Tax=Roseateles sp. DB2 TaxID=3453717 RepID=UPI003EEC1C31
MPALPAWTRRRHTWLLALLVFLLALGGWKLSSHDNDEDAPAAPLSSASTPEAAVPPSPDGIPLAGPLASAVRTSSDSKAWGGPRSGQEATLSDRVVDYRIEARLDPVRHTIDGKQQLRWRNRSDREVRSVYLHLYLNAFEGEGSTFMTEKRQGFAFRTDVESEEGEWGRIELRKVQQQGRAVPYHFVQPDGGPRTDRTVVRLDLPQAVPAGASTVLDIDFFDQLPRVVARTGHFGSFHLVAQWFPKMAVLELPGERGATEPRWNAHEFHLHSEFYADFGSYDVTLDVPEGYVVGATGEEQGAPRKVDGRSIHRFVQGDVHDFAWTADKRSAQPLTGRWSFPGSPEVTIKVLSPPEYAHTMPSVLKATQDALTWFSKTLGPYPYRTVTAVIPPFNAGEAGGMEYPTFFTTDAYKSDKEGTIERFGLDFVTIHEFGHGYFYGILASNEFEEPMLDEGMNQYWNQRMLLAAGRRIPVATDFMQRLGINPSVDVFDAERIASQGNPPDGLGSNAWHRYSSGSYGSVYARTATVMRGLELQLGTEVMDRAIQAYYQRWKFRHPSVADLRDVLAEVSGKPALVDQVFNTHVYAAAGVDDRVEKLESVEVEPPLGLYGPKGSEVTASQRSKQLKAQRKAWDKTHPDAQAKDGGALPYRSTVTLRRRGAAQPQTLLVRFADGSEEKVVWDDQERWKRYSWVKPVKAVSAELDPQQAQRLDMSVADNSRRLKPDSSATRRLISDAGAALMSFLALLSTL